MGKATGTYRVYPSLVKLPLRRTAALVPGFAVKPTLGHNSLTVMLKFQLHDKNDFLSHLNVIDL